MLLRKLFYKINPDQRYYIRRFLNLPLDIYDSLSGKKIKYIPPRGMIFTGRGDYIKLANMFFGYFKTYCNLQPDNRILDIGSGIGRMAVPFIGYLNHQGSYEGIDIVKTGINWCNKNISKINPQFKFIHSDIYNDLYNTKGVIKGEEYVFPYRDVEFDIAFLTSVFTHMLQAEVEQYIKEIARVLKPGGKCLATFFILNDESVSLMNTTEDSFKFPFNHGEYSFMSEDTKTANVAYNQEWIERIMKENGLKVEVIRYGFWSGRNKEEFPDFQDIIIVSKEKKQ
ncbi:MAG: class I SAM-dependent methyltransferase [Bacteroidota bacterium]